MCQNSVYKLARFHVDRRVHLRQYYYHRHWHSLLHCFKKILLTMCLHWVCCYLKELAGHRYGFVVVGLRQGRERRKMDYILDWSFRWRILAHRWILGIMATIYVGLGSCCYCYHGDLITIGREHHRHWQWPFLIVFWHFLGVPINDLT